MGLNGIHVWYCKPGQNAKAEGVIGPRVEPAILILLNSRDPKVPSTYLCSYPYSQAALLLGHRSFCLQWAAVSVKMNAWPGCETKRLSGQCYGGHLYQPALNQGSRNIEEKQAGWRMGRRVVNCSSRDDVVVTLKDSRQLWLPAETLHESKSQNPSIDGADDLKPHLYEELW